MFFSYILRLVCDFNVIFFMIPFNEKGKMPTENLQRTNLYQNIYELYIKVKRTMLDIKLT